MQKTREVYLRLESIGNLVQDRQSIDAALKVDPPGKLAQHANAVLPPAFAALLRAVTLTSHCSPQQRTWTRPEPWKTHARSGTFAVSSGAMPKSSLNTSKGPFEYFLENAKLWR